METACDPVCDIVCRVNGRNQPDLYFFGCGYCKQQALAQYHGAYYYCCLCIAHDMVLAQIRKHKTLVSKNDPGKIPGSFVISRQAV